MRRMIFGGTIHHVETRPDVTEQNLLSMQALSAQNYLEAAKDTDTRAIHDVVYQGRLPNGNNLYRIFTYFLTSDSPLRRPTKTNVGKKK